MLACWSFGLIGLSRFLQCSVSFFLPHPLIGLCRVRFGRTSRHSHRKILFKPKQESRRSFVLYIPQVPFRSLFPVATLAQPAKKTTLHSKKSRQPCRKRQPSAALISLSLHCGLPAAAALSPLATASPLPQSAVQKLRYASHFVQLLSVGSRLLYLLCFSLRPRTAPDHPPQKTVENSC